MCHKRVNYQLQRVVCIKYKCQYFDILLLTTTAFLNFFCLAAPLVNNFTIITQVIQVILLYRFKGQLIWSLAAPLTLSHGTPVCLGIPVENHCNTHSKKICKSKCSNSVLMFRAARTNVTHFSVFKIWHQIWRLLFFTLAPNLRPECNNSLQNFLIISTCNFFKD